VAARSIIYVDGMNLYFGMVKQTPYRWLDLQRLFERLRKDDDIQAIHYFTAIVTGAAQARQMAYLQALATMPKVKVILGRFKTTHAKCSVPACSYKGDRWFSLPEEKRTDVNIAVQMLDDAYQDRADRLVLVTGDSDLVPPVAMVKQRFPAKKVIVYVPARDPVRGAAVELRAAADAHRTLPMALVKVSQLPASLPDGRGGTITKPATW